MTPQQYERLTELFHAALELAPAERTVFLDQVSDGDVDVRLLKLAKQHVHRFSLRNVRRLPQRH